MENNYFVCVCVCVCVQFVADKCINEVVGLFLNSLQVILSQYLACLAIFDYLLNIEL
jgi:hypothetical protein